MNSNYRKPQNRIESQEFFNKTAVKTKVLNRLALYKRGGIKL